jgi:hypothetical protein
MVTSGVLILLPDMYPLTPESTATGQKADNLRALIVDGTLFGIFTCDPTSSSSLVLHRIYAAELLIG